MTKITLSNKILKGMIILAIGILVIAGIYAYGNFINGNPNVLGHTASEINVKLPNGTIKTLQQAFSKDVLIKDSSGNVIVNDVQLGAFYSIYGNNINQYLQEVSRTAGTQIACTWSGWSTSDSIVNNNCTCIIFGHSTSCGQSYSDISCTCVNHIGTKYYCSLGEITQTAKYWYQNQCADYTVTINPDTGSIGGVDVGTITF